MNDTTTKYQIFVCDTDCTDELEADDGTIRLMVNTETPARDADDELNLDAIDEISSLIAAAPAMLEICQCLAATPDGRSPSRELIDDARAVIDKLES